MIPPLPPLPPLDGGKLVHQVNRLRRTESPHGELVILTVIDFLVSSSPTSPEPLSLQRPLARPELSETHEERTSSHPRLLVQERVSVIGVDLPVKLTVSRWSRGVFPYVLTTTVSSGPLDPCSSFSYLRVIVRVDGKTLTGSTRTTISQVLLLGRFSL